MDDIEKQTRLLIIEIMLLLYKNNYTHVHMGGLLRLLGVDEGIAQESDEEFVELSPEFTKYISANLEDDPDLDSTNKTLH